MIEKINNLYESGNYQKTLDFIIEFEKDEKFKNYRIEDHYLLYYYKCRSLEQLGKYSEAYDISKQKINELKQQKNKLIVLILMIAELYALFRLGKYDKALIRSKKGKELISIIEKKNYENKEEWIALFKNITGVIFHQKGDLDEALKFYNQSLDLREKNNISKDIAISLNNIGAVYAHKGYFEKALSYYERSLTTSESINNFQGIAYALNNLGTVYEEKGNNKVALDYYKRSLEVKQSIGNQYDIAGTLHNIAVVHHNEGNLNKALIFFNRSLEIKRQIGNDLHTTSTLHSVILIYLDLEDSIRTKDLIKEMETINKRKSNLTISTFYRLSKALILKKSIRMVDKSQSQLILKQIVNEKVILNKLTLLAMVNLCELLLFELKAIGEIEILVEARDLVNKLFNLSKLQKSYSLTIRVLILRTQFAVIAGELEIGLENLEKAENIASANNLKILLKLVKEEKKHLESEFENWQKLIEQNFSIQHRLEQIRLEEYTNDIKKLVLNIKN